MNFNTHLCTKAIISAARPDPSQTTTGTGGVSVTYSKTARIVLVPPSMTKQTTGVLECVTAMRAQKLVRIQDMETGNGNKAKILASAFDGQIVK